MRPNKTKGDSEKSQTQFQLSSKGVKTSDMHLEHRKKSAKHELT